MSDGPRIVAVGEGMLEFSKAGSGWQLGYGGDTLNTALHLARFGLDTSYMTALGEDAFSHNLRAAWASEGLRTDLILTDSTRQPGLYAIRTDHQGERSFVYWRENSAARQMFELAGTERAIEIAQKADLLLYSLITLAILPPAGRERIFDLARDVRAAGGQVAFDGNYRPKLWRNVEEARVARDTAIATCTIGLPTLADEQTLCGQPDETSVASDWASLGADEVVVKLGARGCFADGRVIAPPRDVQPADTSGAGDAFDAGFLAARLTRAPMTVAAEAGQKLAGWVIERAGAIPARDAVAPYSLG